MDSKGHGWPASNLCQSLSPPSSPAAVSFRKQPFLRQSGDETLHCSGTKLDLSCYKEGWGGGFSAESWCGWTSAPDAPWTGQMNTRTHAAGRTSVPWQHRKLLNQAVSAVVLSLRGSRIAEVSSQKSCSSFLPNSNPKHFQMVLGLNNQSSSF